MNFSDLPAHFGVPYANQELEWLPTDTQESYQRLIQDEQHRAYFAQQGWDQPRAITYKINSQGFRADEFDSGPYLVALGCSYTIGIGLPDAVTWPRRVATAMGLRCANLAWGGYSTDSCYRLAEYWIPALRPNYVCMLLPPKHRLELILDLSWPTRFEVFMPNSQSSIFRDSDPYLKHWYANAKNAEINQRKNARAVRELCRELGIPCTVLDAETHMSLSRKEIGYARDHMHGGPPVHESLARKFLDAYPS